VAEDLLMDVPHRQFVFTIPKILRPYFYGALVLVLLYSVLFYLSVQGRPVYTEFSGRKGTIVAILRQGLPYQVGLRLGGGSAE
jgi:hypothetical protein